MSFLSKLFGRGETAPATDEEFVCRHINLTAGWDNPDDMGMEAKASHFVCAACGARFTPDEAAGLRAQAQRIV